MASDGPCSYSGCRRTAFFNSDYCNIHRDEIGPINTNSNNISSTNESGIGNHIIRFQIDGRKKNIDSKEIGNLLSHLKKAKKFWIVDLTVDENEFVQYAIEKGELEHWDRLEMIESMEMTTEEAFATLRTKITGEYSGPLLWWSDEPAEGHSEEDLEQQENNFAVFAFVLACSAAFIVGIFVFGDPQMALGNLIGELFCQGICALVFVAGGAGASALGRSDSGKFTK
jgi:hypothetical protein